MIFFTIFRADHPQTLPDGTNALITYQTVEIIKTGGVCELRHDGNSEGGKGRGHHAAASRRIESAALRAFGFGRAMAM